MRSDIHPKYTRTEILCSCGSKTITRSTFAADEARIDVCSSCHPFYSGKDKLIDTEGRVDRFMKRYGVQKKQDANKAAE